MYIQKFPFYFINVLMHLAVYFIFSIAPFKKDYRFNNKITILITTLFIAFFCVSDILIFEKGAPYLFLKKYMTMFTLVIVFAYGMIIVKKHYFQLMFIVTVCMIFHINFVTLSNAVLHYYPVAPILEWFPEINDLLMQFAVLAIFLYPMYYLSAKLFTKVLDNNLDFLQWRFTLLLPLFLLSFSMCYNYFISNKLEKGYMDICIILLYMIGFYFCYLSVLKILIIGNQKHIIEEENLLASKQIEFQKAKTTQLNDFIYNTSRIRHDWRQHYLTIKGLIESNQIDKAKEYFSRYDKTQIIYEDSSVCENKSIDAILRYYISYAKSISAQVSLQVNIPEKICIDEIELCACIGNVVENACEACARQNSDNKFINIHADIVGKQLIYIVSNSFDGEILEKSGDIFSSKKLNQLGIGLDSVKKIVNANGGNITISYGDKVFKVSVVLNLT